MKLTLTELNALARKMSEILEEDDRVYRANEKIDTWRAKPEPHKFFTKAGSGPGRPKKDKTNEGH